MAVARALISLASLHSVAAFAVMTGGKKCNYVPSTVAQTSMGRRAQAVDAGCADPLPQRARGGVFIEHHLRSEPNTRLVGVRGRMTGTAGDPQHYSARTVAGTAGTDEVGWRSTTGETCGQCVASFPSAANACKRVRGMARRRPLCEQCVPEPRCALRGRGGCTTGCPLHCPPRALNCAFVVCLFRYAKAKNWCTALGGYGTGQTCSPANAVRPRQPRCATAAGSSLVKPRGL